MKTMQTRIDDLLAAGGSRWSKGDQDRIYFNDLPGKNVKVWWDIVTGEWASNISTRSMALDYYAQIEARIEALRSESGSTYSEPAVAEPSVVEQAAPTESYLSIYNAAQAKYQSNRVAPAPPASIPENWFDAEIGGGSNGDAGRAYEMPRKSGNGTTGPCPHCGGYCDGDCEVNGL